MDRIAAEGSNDLSGKIVGSHQPHQSLIFIIGKLLALICGKLSNFLYKNFGGVTGSLGRLHPPTTTDDYRFINLWSSVGFIVWCKLD